MFSKCRAVLNQCDAIITVGRVVPVDTVCPSDNNPQPSFLYDPTELFQLQNTSPHWNFCTTTITTETFRISTGGLRASQK